MPRSAVVALGIALVPALVAGCGSDGLNPPQFVDENRLYWELELNHHAALMSNHAPYDTLTLRSVARNIHGQLLPQASQPIYMSRDPEHVAVTPDGMLRALGPTSGPVAVVATLTIDNVKHFDSIFVKVVDEPSPQRLVTFSIHPVPPDSAKSAVGGFGNAAACFVPPGEPSCLFGHAVQIADSSGTPIDGAPVWFKSSDPTIATIGPQSNRRYQVQYANRSRLGVVTFYASTTVFGTMKADTLPYTIGWPLWAGRYPAIEGLSPEIRIAAGGLVFFDAHNDASQLDTLPMEVLFSDPTAAMAVSPEGEAILPSADVYCGVFQVCSDAGNILIDASGIGQAWRRFPRPGTYEYRIPRLPFSKDSTGFTGRIIVIDESADAELKALSAATEPIVRP